jgi:nitrite reductase/ring-hydroxylating ferredoxin subunit
MTAGGASTTHTLDRTLAPGESIVVRIDDTPVLVGRLADGALYAVDNRCPHEGYPLAKGTVDGCVLTCRWHNFRFDVRTGHALQGDEAVRTWPVREEEGGIVLDTTPPDPDLQRTRHRAAFREAVLDGRNGQAAREVARLLVLGVAPRSLLIDLCRLDGRHSRYGTTHVLPLAADVLAQMPNGTDRVTREHQVLLVQQVVDVAIRSVQRRPERPVESVHVDDPVQALRAALADEAPDRAEALARLAAGRDPEGLYAAFVQRCGDHFLGFGHGLIYTTKLAELGAIDDPDIVGGLARQLIGLTPEDVLPEWAPWRAWRDTLDADALARIPAQTAGPDDLVPRLVDAPPRAAYPLVAEALTAGRRHDVLDALTVVAAARVQRFDARIDGDHTVQNDWLDVTHILTFADAVRRVDLATPTGIRLLLQLTRFATHHRVLDGRPHPRSHPDPVGTAREAALADVYTAPIVVAHVLKTAAAAERLASELPVPWSEAPLDALDAFVSQPVQQRFQARAVADACRFVFDGKVPRSRT